MQEDAGLQGGCLQENKEIYTSIMLHEFECIERFTFLEKDRELIFDRYIEKQAYKYNEIVINCREN